MKKPKIAIVRGAFLNRYEMQFFEPLVDRFDITAFSSLKPFHTSYAFPIIQLPSPMDVPDFPLKMPILNRIFVDAHYLLGLEEKLRGYDIVHTAETYYHYTQQALNAKRNGYVRKVIATVLENIPGNNEGIWGRKAFKARARRELDHIIALTQKTKEALLAEGTDAGKITVISHHIDTTRFAPDPRKQKELFDGGKTSFRIVFCGRFEKNKGVYTILDAFIMLKRDPTLAGRALTLLFVGMGSEHQRMKRSVRDNCLDSFVEFRHASYADMPGVYREADIYVAPSIPTETWEEQYNTTLLEAQAAGLPIVTTRTGGIPENVGDAAILVDPERPDELAREIKRLITDAGLRRRLAQAARTRAVTVHDVHIGARKLTMLYQMLLS